MPRSADRAPSSWRSTKPWPCRRSGADIDLLGLNDALDRLAELDERQGRIVELRFFAGLSIEETAEVMHLSPASIKREWQTARAWLFREMTRTPAYEA